MELVRYRLVMNRTSVPLFLPGGLFVQSGAQVDQPLTRRQLREMERAAEAAAAASNSGETAGVTSEGAETPDVGQFRFPETGRELPAPNLIAEVLEARETDASPLIQMGDTPSDNVTLQISQIRQRRDVRAAMPWQPVRKVGSQHVSRAALVGTLGIVTIAAPMTGFGSSSMAAEAAELAPQSVGEFVSAAAADHLLDGTISTATSLREDPMARIVATDLSARAQARSVITSCTPTSGANGFSEAYVERVAAPTRPMAEGTFTSTSRYGWRWGQIHLGTDMAAPVGTPIYSVADGTVVHAGAGIEGRSGTLVIVEAVIDGEPTWFWFGHMYSDQVYVEVGDTVRAGQIIAGVGNSGRSTGPHLHFEVHTGSWDNVVNPDVWLNQHDAVFPGQC